MSTLPELIMKPIEVAFSNIPSGYKTYTAIAIAILILSFRFVLSETGIGIIKSAINIRDKDIDRHLELVANADVEPHIKSALIKKVNYLIKKGVVDIEDKPLQDALINESAHRNINLKALKGLDSYLRLDGGVYKLKKSFFIFDLIVSILLALTIVAFLTAIIYSLMITPASIDTSTFSLLIVIVVAFVFYLYLFQRTFYKIKTSWKLRNNNVQP